MTQEATSKKNNAFKEWYRVKSQETRDEYNKCKRKARAVVKEERRKWFLGWTEEMREDVHGNKKMLYGLMRERRKKKDECQNLVKENGEVVTDDERKKQMWKTYFETLLNPGINQQPIRAPGQIQRELEEPRDEDEEEDYITWREVEMAMKKMKNGKAVGVDELAMEMIRAAGVVGIQWLYRVLNVIWKNKTVPLE